MDISRSILKNSVADEPARFPHFRSEPNPQHIDKNLPPIRAWRVRVRSDDHPGTLARFAIRLADLECRVLGLTRHPAPDGVLDEFVVRPAAGLPQHLLIDALRDEGGDCLGMTEIAIPQVRTPAATAPTALAQTALAPTAPVQTAAAPAAAAPAAAAESIAGAAARELLAPITDPPAADPATVAGADAQKLPAPAPTAFPAPTSLPEPTAHPASPALPVAGEFCIGADIRELHSSAATASTAEEKTADTGKSRAQKASPAEDKTDAERTARELPVPEPAAGKLAGVREFRKHKLSAFTSPSETIDAAQESSIPATAAVQESAAAAERETTAETTVRGLRDSAVTALVAARRAIADPESRAPMLRMVLSADLVTLVPASEANPGRTEGGHRAVFPFGDGQAFVARRRWVAFAEAELAQAAAFLELLAAAEENLAGPVVLDRPDGVAVVLRLGTPRDIDAIGAVHLRCSAKTLFNRYHTGLRTVPRKWLHRLLMPPRGTSVLAVCGRDVIGFGQLISQLDGTAEVSLLVEDAWQRQGIGTALLARLAALAGAEGRTELIAVRLPGNDAMTRTAVRAGLRVETSPDDATVLRLGVARTPRKLSGSRTSLCPAPRAVPASSVRE